MNINDVNILNEKAKSRKNEIYSYNKYLYVVKDYKFKGFIDAFESYYIINGFFTILIGKVKSYKHRRKLIELIKSQDI